jgi:hypothetical protein
MDHAFIRAEPEADMSCRLASPSLGSLVASVIHGQHSIPEVAEDVPGETVRQYSSPVGAFAPLKRFQPLSNTADGFALHQRADHCPGRLIDPEQSNNHLIALNRSI